MNNKGLAVKIKIIIIIVYTFVFFGVILLSFGRHVDKRYKNYGTQPYDDCLGLSLRVVEERQSKTLIGSNDEKGIHEKANYDLQITVFKLKTSTYVRNLKLYLAAKTVSGGYRYDDYATYSKAMSAQTYISLTSFNDFSTKEIKELNKNGKTKEFLFDETPVEFFIKLTYQITDSDSDNAKVLSEHVLEYKTSILDFKEEKEFEKADSRSVKASESNFIDPKEDPIKLKIENYELTKEEAETKNAYRIECRINLPGLNKYKYDKDYLTNNKLKEIELPKAENESDAWDVSPELKDVKFEVYAKIKNDDSEFSKYVKIYSVYGFFSRFRQLSTLTYSIEKEFTVEEIYVIAEGNIYNGTQKSFKTVYKLDASEIK